MLSFKRQHVFKTRMSKSSISALHLSKKYIFLVAVTSIAALVIVQFLFSIKAPIKCLQPVWDANGLLGYLGAFVGSMSAVAVLYFSLLAGKEDRKHSDEMAVLPCIALSNLSKKRICLRRGRFVNSVFQDNDQPVDGYISGTLNEVDYLRVGNGGSAVSSESHPEGYTSDYRYVLSSVGLGPAVNVRVGIATRNEMIHCQVPNITWCQMRQLPLGQESELVVCFDGGIDSLSQAGYRIVVSYLDILGNQYVQSFPISFGQRDGVPGLSVGYTVNRMRVGESRPMDRCGNLQNLMD